MLARLQSFRRFSKEKSSSWSYYITQGAIRYHLYLAADEERQTPCVKRHLRLMGFNGRSTFHASIASIVLFQGLSGRTEHSRSSQYNNEANHSSRLSSLQCVAYWMEIDLQVSSQARQRIVVPKRHAGSCFRLAISWPIISLKPFNNRAKNRDFVTKLYYCHTTSTVRCQFISKKSAAMQTYCY